jgi:hypothetical protein
VRPEQVHLAFADAVGEMRVGPPALSTRSEATTPPRRASPPWCGSRRP